MKLGEIIYENEYSCDKSVQNLDVLRISTSTDTIDSETVFVVIRSIKFDVTKIINYVLNQRPAAIICDRELEVDSDTIPILRTENTRTLLPYFYSRYYEVDFNKMRFIGITGTNGKTTTATMLSHILSYAERSVGFIGTGKILINGKQISEKQYSMTTPDPELLYRTIRKMQDSGCEFVVMEVSSHALYFEKVAPIPFNVSVFTNLSPEHMDFHKNIDDYYACKNKLFKQTDIGIFNMDDEYSAKAATDCKAKKRCIGIIQNADIVARDVAMHGLDGSEYIYRESHRLFKVKLRFGGAYNIYNSMMAIAASIELGIKPCIAKEAISRLASIDGRLEIIRDDITVIIDYAHTEAAMGNVLKFINSIKKPEQKLITVFGCGGERDHMKRPKMAEIAESFSDFVIVTTDNSRGESEADIIKDILCGFRSTERRKVITSREAAIEQAILSANAGDIIALIGKGHERYNIDKSGCHDFDEKEIINRALKKRKAGQKESNEDNSEAFANT